MQIHPTVRIAAALLTFLLIAGGSVWLLKKPGPSAEVIHTSASSATPREDVFYHTIGAVTAAQHTKIQNGSHPDKRFTLEIKVFDTQEEAQQMVSVLEAKGIQVFYSPMQNGNRVIYRLRYGVFAHSQEAKKSAEDLKKNHQLSTQIVELL